MELLQLKYFLTAAQMGHLTRAAESLYISQPALSRAIRRLETELGLSLFEKKGRGVALTEYGQHFYTRVWNIFSELREDEQERRDLLGQSDTRIRLGTTIPGITLPVLETYHDMEPEVQFFHESVKSNQELLELISGEELELGFCDASIFPSDLEHTPIWEDQLYAILPVGHPLTACEALSFRELETQTLILSHAESSLWDIIAAFRQGREPRSYMHTASMPEALRLCLMGMGITITSGFFLEIQMRESIHDGKSLLNFAVPVPLEHCKWNISLVWKRRSYYNRQLRAFLAHAISYYQSRSEQSILQLVVKKELREACSE